MERLRRLRLLIRAWWTVAWIRAAQVVVPHARLLSFLERHRRSSAAEGPSPREVSRAVLRTSFWVPDGASCLPQALAVRYLLNRQGLDARLRFGVARAEEGAFQAHAWVELDGKILIGKQEADRYTPLSRPASPDRSG